MARLIGFASVPWFPEHSGEATTEAPCKPRPVSGIDRAEVVTLGRFAICVCEKCRVVLRVWRSCTVPKADPDWKMAPLAIRHPKIGVHRAGAPVPIKTTPSIVSGNVALNVPRLQHVDERHMRFDFPDELCIGLMAREARVAIKQRDGSELTR